MIVVFNIGMIGLVALIAYWWSNQGLFSAILHLLCVIVAGAVALGVWEPIVGSMLNGGWFDSYAWGVTLVGVFAITLLILRVITDKTIRANVDIPHWANMLFGLPVGALAGILTMGITFIGCGNIQSTTKIVGYAGYGPTQSGEIVKYGASMWVPVHQLTAEFYSWLSVTSMWTPDPMRRKYPKMHWQSCLARASYSAGLGQISMPPDGATIRGAMQGDNKAAVRVKFNASSLDFGEQLTLSKSQIRLISHARGTAAAQVKHPDSWVQEGTMYLFDNYTHYITSTPGQEGAEATILFTVPAGFIPRYIQLKGTRFELPRLEEMPASLLDGASAMDDVEPVTFAGGSPIPGSDIDVSNSIRPIRVSKNKMPGGMKIRDNYFVEGYGTFTSARGKISRALVMEGIYEPEGTKTVILDVSRGRTCDLFAKGLSEQAGASAQIQMYDSNGRAYSPMGYIHERGEGKVDLKLVPGKYLRNFEDLPYLPTTGTERLRLYFRVTTGVTLSAFKYGDVTLGTCSLVVEE